MSGRERDRNREKDRDRDRDRDRGNTKPRQSTFFINGAGIDREVITTDICRYLGHDALVKPCQHPDGQGNLQDGYYITAYRAPTSAQLQDLRSDSQKWLEEKRKTSTRGLASQVAYDRSQVRAAYENDPPPVPPPQYQQAYQQQQLPPSRGPLGRGYEPSSYNSAATMAPPGGYRAEQPNYPAQPGYVYGTPQQSATVTYGTENYPGRDERDPRMMPTYAGGPGGPPPSQVFASRAEPFNYNPSSGTAPPSNRYGGDYYGRPGPNPGFAPPGAMEEMDESEPFENHDEMDFDSPATIPLSTPNQPRPGGGGHRDPPDNPNPNKRRPGR